MASTLEPAANIAPHELETLSQCPLCASARISPAPVRAPEPYGFVLCADCGGVFLSPRLTLAGLQRLYDAHYGEHGNPRPDEQHASRARRHVQRLRSVAPAPGRVLDLGAGDGHFLKEARDIGWQVEGIELSEPRLRRAREMFGLVLTAADLATVEFPAASFDAITMFQLIEHLHTPRPVLERLHRFLRPGGVLLVSTPNILAHARKGRGAAKWGMPYHVLFFTPRSLVRTLESAGFEVLSAKMKLHAALETKLGWRAWPGSPRLVEVGRDLLTPFGLSLAARKR